MMDESKLYLFMDETGRPYEEGENPFPDTPEMDEIENKIIEKYGLVLAEDEEEDENTPNVTDCICDRYDYKE